MDANSSFAKVDGLKADQSVTFTSDQKKIESYVRKLRRSYPDRRYSMTHVESILIVRRLK